MTTDLQLPTIHLNGTNKERLIEGLCAVSSHLNDAYDALKEACPNGRDYYPQGPEAMRRAEDQHRSRLARIDEVKNEIDALAFSISQIGE